MACGLTGDQVLEIVETARQTAYAIASRGCDNCGEDRCPECQIEGALYGLVFAIDPLSETFPAVGEEDCRYEGKRPAVASPPP